MIVVLEQGSTQEHVGEILAELEALGLRGRPLEASGKTLIHVLGGPTRVARSLLKHRRVEALVPTSGPRIRRRGRKFYPYYFIAWCALFLLMSGMLVFLAGFLPPGVVSEVQLGSPPQDLGVPWYLRGVQEFLGLFANGRPWLGWLALGAIAALVFFVPVIDRTRGRRSPAGWLIVGAGLLLVLGFLFLSFRRLLA